jgi:hypothetical protein
LIFITAKVVSAEGASVEQIFDANQVRNMELRKSDLPGYRETTSAVLPDEDPAKVKDPFPFTNSGAKGSK